jgi:cytochrome d ubiquinol oxidase subunit II
MATLWFWLAAVMIAGYVLLDGLDIGAGILHRFVARNPLERAMVLRSIGPVWDGNEVWLLAGGGTLVLAFPAVYATAFSGFYLPLMLVLWLLIGRACAIELRHQVKADSWASFWDTIFQVCSVLLAVCFGAALGNVVRGVPIGADGQFFEPLWADGDVPGQVGILDGYTVLIGVAALAALALHGALWLAYKLEGDVQARSRRLARVLTLVVAVVSLIVTAATFSVQPHVKDRLLGAPAGFVFPALAVAGLVAVHRRLRARDDLGALFGSAAYLGGMLTSAAYGCYPYLLPSTPDASRGMTVHDSAAADATLSLSLWWWIPAFAITVAYQVWIYRQFAGKVRPGEGHYG